MLIYWVELLKKRPHLAKKKLLYHHDNVLADRRLKIREIADIVDISTERIQNILHEKLGMRKLLARWVPRLLTV